MFRLLRYFSVMSLLAFAVVTVLLGILYRQTAVNNLIELEETKNVVLTKSLANSLWPILVPYIDSSSGLTAEELRTRPEIAELSWSIVSQITGLSVVKVKVYNLEGTTVFSTEVEQIGEDASHNRGYRSALEGHIISELTHRDAFNAYDGIIEDQDVLFTYTPVYSDGPTGKIQGVIELYSNVTPLLNRIERVQGTVMFGVAAILALLYLALFLIVRRADWIIRRQHNQQLEAEEKLRQEQRAVVILKERERLARELHDSLGQILGYVKMQSQAALEHLNQNRLETSQSHLKRLIDAVQSAHVEIRETILNLQSGVDKAQDLLEALEDHLMRFRQLSDIPIEVSISPDIEECKLEPHVETQLIRIIQEALANIRKHAEATSAKVSFEVVSSRMLVTVQDDGRGFHPASVPASNGRHFGLDIMGKRTQEIGGQFKIRSAPGTGCTVAVSIPLNGH